jgi:DNA polymerase-3 subunit beta
VPTATVVKEDLAAALALPRSVVAKRSTIPILACLLLRQSRGELHVVGTDMDIGVATRCPLRDHDWPDGSAGVAVDADLLAAVVAAAPKGGEIRLASGPSGLLVSHALERARLPVLQGDEFPSLKEPDGTAVEIAAEGAKLAAALARVAAAISREETRYYLGGVFVEVVGHHVELTATDGHRLHHTWLEPDGIEGEGVGVILPRRLVELLAGIEGELTLRLGATGVSVAGGFGRITSRVIDGQFPDYRRIIPPPSSDGLELSGGEVEAAVKRLRGFGDGALGLWLEQERLSLQAATEEAAAIAETSIAGVARGAAEPLQTGVKGRYLADAAAVAGGGRMVVSWSGPSAPMRVAFADRPDDVVVLMPMRMGAWREVE